MDCIELVKRGINVRKVVEQLEQYPDDWFIQRKGTDTLLERGYADIEVGNLQLIMGAVKKKCEEVRDSSMQHLQSFISQRKKKRMERKSSETLSKQRRINHV